MQVKQVKPTLWDAAEEAQAHQAGLKSLCSGLLGDPLTDDGLSQLGRALWELQVSKLHVMDEEECHLPEVMQLRKGGAGTLTSLISKP
ncbi:hypothetical protein D623_10027833 [Myotis brandtii]|uniref:Uncharacterized protein n=1 Tax=Myotis brandtii TaxID=109478 RepID=S7NI10_MYOBR|nr:hypothetical protein D623_10027833 [Myotis brandtii]